MYEHEREEKKVRKPKQATTSYPAHDASVAPLMARYMESRKLPLTLAQQNFWYPISQQGARICIPLYSSMGGCYWQARAIQGDEPRYLSPPVSRGDAICLVWPRETPFRCCVVEGPFDALAAAECGLLGIGLMGNAPPQIVLDRVIEIAKIYTVCYCIPDSGALQEMRNIAALLAMGGVRDVRLGEVVAKDLAEIEPLKRGAYLDAIVAHQ